MFMLQIIFMKLATRSLAVSNPVQAGDREPRSSRGRGALVLLLFFVFALIAYVIVWAFEQRKQ